MGNDMTTPLPTWDDVRDASNELDQMASQTVLKACDVGDMLRAIRLTMNAESFVSQCNTELNRQKAWAHQMIVLSFRRSAVLDALANGKANDSIRSAYEHVKGLPESAEETEERAQWPKAQRGPKKGSGNAGRPKGTAAPKPKGTAAPKPKGTAAPKPKASYRQGWQALLYTESEYAEQMGKRQLADRKAAVEEAVGYDVPSTFTDREAAEQFVIDFDTKYAPTFLDPPDKKEIQAKKETLAQSKQREFDKLFKQEVARIRAVGNKELREEMEKLKAQWQVKIDAVSERERQKLAEYVRARQIREGLTAIMPNEEFDKLIRLLHPDRYPEEYRSKVDEAVQILRRYVSPCLNRDPKPIPKAANPFRENANV